MGGLGPDMGWAPARHLRSRLGLGLDTAYVFKVKPGLDMPQHDPIHEHPTSPTS